MRFWKNDLTGSANSYSFLLLIALLSLSRTKTSQSRWELVADIEPYSNFATGALVEHERGLPQGPVLVHRVDSTELTTNGTTVTLLTAGGRVLPNQDVRELTLVGGCFVFALEKLNTQGGATLRSKAPVVGLHGTLLSLEWLEPAIDNIFDLDTPFQLATHRIANLRASRMDNLHNLTREVKEQRQDFAGVSLMAVGQRLYYPTISAQIREPVKLRETLLALPFVLFNPLLLPFLTQLKRPDREIVRVWLNVAFECFNDRLWTAQCKSLIVPGMESDGDEKLHAQMFESMFIFLNSLGKWFASQGEYPASIWCHEKNLALSVANCMDQFIANSLEFLAKTHGRRGNTLSAFRCLEQAMAFQCTESRVKEARALRSSVRGLVGTSGYLTPFYTRPTLLADGGNVCQDQQRNVCASCGRVEQQNVATCCRLVCYCNATCQKKHWVRVHKHTCLFGKSGELVE